jgi:hypothetical protein
MFASKMTFVEVMLMVKAKKYLGFRGLDFRDLETLGRLPELKSGMRRVTMCFGKGGLVNGDAVERAREHLTEVMRFLDGFEGGVRMFVRFDEAAGRGLNKGDRRLEIFAGMVGSRGLREAVEYCRGCKRRVFENCQMS